MSFLQVYFHVICLLVGILLLAKGYEAMSTGNSTMLRARRMGGSSCSGLPRSLDPRKIITMRRRWKINREYLIITPPNYDSTVTYKVLLLFHGWLEEAIDYVDSEEWMDVFKRFKDYVVVVPQGIGQSWQFPGSSDGIGSDGKTVTTCDTSYDEPNDCYDSCPCLSRCGWTQCQDDDQGFALDLIQDIHNYICVDDDHIYAAGISNGGMMTWSIAQDERVAPLLAGIAPMIGTALYDYNMGLPGTASSRGLPVIGFYGNTDPIVPPGNFEGDWVEDSSGFYWIPAHRMHTRFAMDNGCKVRNENGPPPFIYYETDNLQGYSVICRTHCNINNADDDGYDAPPPYSVDCRAEMGHETPAWMMHMAFSFFDQHDRFRQSKRDRTPNKCSDCNRSNIIELQGPP